MGVGGAAATFDAAGWGGVAITVFALFARAGRPLFFPIASLITTSIGGESFGTTGPDDDEELPLDSGSAAAGCAEDEDVARLGR